MDIHNKWENLDYKFLHFSLGQERCQKVTKKKKKTSLTQSDFSELLGMFCCPWSIDGESRAPRGTVPQPRPQQDGLAPDSTLLPDARRRPFCKNLVMSGSTVVTLFVIGVFVWKVHLRAHFDCVRRAECLEGEHTWRVLELVPLPRTEAASAPLFPCDSPQFLPCGCALVAAWLGGAGPHPFPMSCPRGERPSVPAPTCRWRWETLCPGINPRPTWEPEHVQLPGCALTVQAHTDHERTLLETAFVPSLLSHPSVPSGLCLSVTTAHKCYVAAATCQDLRVIRATES